MKAPIRRNVVWLQRKLFSYYLRSYLVRRIIKPFVSILPFIANLYGSKFEVITAFIKKTQFYPAMNLSYYQKIKLKQLIQHAYVKSSFYREQMMRAGIDSYSDLKSMDILKVVGLLPFTDKRIIKHNFEKIVIDDIKKMTDYVSTGGSGGEPFFFYINSDRSVKEWAFMVDLWSRVGFTPASKRASFRGSVVTKLYEDDPLTRERRYSSFRLNDEYLREIWPGLLKYAPEFIYAYPSAAFIMARYAKRYNAEIPPSIKCILIGSENIYDDRRMFIEDVFRVRTYAWYGHSEKLVLAGECEREKVYHAYPQYGYVEFINQNGEKAKPGEFAEIVGTGFINTAMPFIRYRTGDWCTYLGDSCQKCGRNFPIFKDIMGRWDQEMLVGREGNLIPYTAVNIHTNQFDNVSQFQFYQDDVGRVTLKLVPEKNFSEENRQAIHKVLSQKMKHTVELKTVIVDDIPLTVSGKYKFIDQRLDLTPFLGED